MSYENFKKGLMTKDIAKMRVTLSFRNPMTGKTVKFSEREFHPADATPEEVNRLVEYYKVLGNDWRSNRDIEDPETGTTFREYLMYSTVFVSLITYEHAYITLQAEFMHIPSWQFLIRNTFSQMTN